MQKQIGSIIIKFTDKEYYKLKEIEDIIKKNKYIFNYITDPITIDLKENPNEFDIMFKGLVDGIYNNDEIKKLIDNEAFLPSVYIESLIRKKGIEDISIIPSNVNTTDEMVSTFLALAYFKKKGNFNDFSEYIKHRYFDDKIFEWAKNESRVNNYEYVLESICDTLYDFNPVYLEQMGFIFKKTMNKSTEDFIKIGENLKKQKNYTKISEDEFEKLFYEFLEYIGAPENWKNKYEYLKEKNLITKSESDEVVSCCYLDNGEYKILFGKCNNIMGFFEFVHEFIHYISKTTIEKIMVSEFGSIYFEKEVAVFLNKKGFNKKIIEDIMIFRESSNYKTCLSIISLFTDIMEYYKTSHINIDEKINRYKQDISLINDARQKLVDLLIKEGKEVDKSLLPNFNIDYEKEINDEIDTNIDIFLVKGIEIIRGYQYLLDSYLVEKVLENKDENTNSKMINVVNNLKDYEIDEIKEEFNIRSLFDINSLKKVK